MTNLRTTVIHKRVFLPTFFRGSFLKTCQTLGAFSIVFPENVNMGIFKHTQELKLRVAAKRMFKALVTDIDNIPLPAAIKSIDTLQGDGKSRTTIR
ncbi:hypothetical protein CASFOL_000712 [Castilleja foliolosa]|uniref:Uncharacterized protein n=1 Tax=Castilleja foliolosa TaxID=1961234 RepID=A0ABD3ENR8_9LAMI